MTPIEAFMQAPTAVKIGVGVALVGMAIYAVVKARSKPASPQVDSAGNVINAGTNGAVSVSDLLKGLGYDTSTTAAETAGGNVLAAQAGAGTPPAAIAQRPPVSGPNPVPPSTARYVNVQKWYQSSTGDTTLGNIASNEHVGGGLAGLLKLNPTIQNPNVITPGERIRVA
jgi:hypothetical protein